MSGEHEEQPEELGTALDQTDSYVAATQLYETDELVQAEDEFETKHNDAKLSAPELPHVVSGADVFKSREDIGEVLDIKPVIDPASNTDKTNPLVQASIISRLNFFWISPLIAKGWKTALNLSDVFELPWNMRTENVFERFERVWEEELRRKGPEKASIAWTMARMYPWEIFEQAAVIIIWMGFFVTTPAFFMNELIKFTVNDRSIGYGMFLAFGVMICEWLRSVTAQYYWQVGTRLAVKLQGLMYSLVYNKAIRLRDLSGYTVGELVNIASNDGQRVFDAVTLSGFIYTSFILGVIVLVLSSVMVGPFAIFGFGIYILMIPVQSYVATTAGKLRRSGIKFTDSRVRLMNEILTCIRLIKMYAWERPFSSHIQKMRENERRILAKASYIESIVVSLVPVAPVVAGVLTYSLAAVTGYDLTAADAFTVMALFNLMRFTLGTVPRAVRANSETKVGFERLKRFLLLENRLRRYPVPTNEKNAVEVKHASFSWAAIKDLDDLNTGSKKGGDGPKQPGAVDGKQNGAGALQNGAGAPQNGANAAGKGKKKGQKAVPKKVPVATRVLFGIDVEIKTGELVGICGGVGSGKSSFLAAILGQMQVDEGTVKALPNIAYVSQQAWIQNQTLKTNILFGQPFDEDRYRKVTDVCCLLPDIESLPAKDDTEIGERGINLSGGQKQRVSMARAVYANKDVYILDDPLSAVDAHVGKRIFEECIKGVLAGKTVILVTHQLQFLPQCDRVLFFDQGRIKEVGTYTQLLANKAGFTALVNARQKELSSEEEEKKRKEEEEAEKLRKEQELQAALLETVMLSKSPSAVSESHTEKEESPEPSAILLATAGTAISVEGSVVNADTSAHNPDSVTTEAPKEKSVTALALTALPLASEGSAEATNTAASQVEKTKEQVAEEAKAAADAKEEGKKLVTEEIRERGSVTWRTYKKYAQASSGITVASIVMFFFIVSTVAKWFSDWWLSHWLEKGDGKGNKNPGNITDNPDLHTYALVYGMSAVIIIILQMVRAYLFNSRVLVSSTRLHRELFNAVVHAPMSFFDTTPTGRILNRFSKDMDDVDAQLPKTLEQFIQNVCLILLGIAVVASVLPYFLISLIPIMSFYFFVVRYFGPTQRELKRIDNICRSPLFSKLTATLQGLPTLHAFSKESEFLTDFHHKLNDNMRVMFAFWCASRWFAYRLDFVTVFMTFATAICVVSLRDTINPGDAGLALLYITSLGGFFQFTTRMAAETEARFTSVERITGYTEDLPREGLPSSEIKEAPENWPTEGGIEVRNLVVRYRPRLPPVLKGVSLKIKPFEKIGIAGRTGSGKSTLMTCLFRLLEPSSGTILIDGVDICKLDLEALRSRLAIIPQDPVLFVGTVRFNLDPFSTHTDEELWRALENAHMKDAISALPAGLEAPVVENGENFSVGERQLICLARALLRDSKILVLDEATSAADAKTDRAIQKTIRESFAGKRTLLTIAHRLDTILDSDRILVLDAGEVAEFAPPAELLQNPDSLFSKMLKSTAEASKNL